MASYDEDHDLVSSSQMETGEESRVSLQVSELVDWMNTLEIEDNAEEEGDWRGNLLSWLTNQAPLLPVSKKAIEKLRTLQLTEDIPSDNSVCVVCADSFQPGDEAKQLPCQHLYHSACILSWFRQHNSCPLCRHELPTDNPIYEAQRRDRERWKDASHMFA
ncbi:E3 ubiquitin-protein ligase RING1 [Galdieria sulphuraria]|nr:E3 ubiquitin-protein ligase RING1 [Galdieria sulphuraria]